MCGFGVILRTGGGSIPESWLDTLDAAVAVRGPDGHGRFRDRAGEGSAAVAVAMVHRRLAVIDPEGGAQPMVHRAAGDSDDLVSVVFNGFIANHRELRTHLTSAGHRFRSDHCDTEVLVHGSRAWGDGLPGRLEGMFAAAVWDRRRRRLQLLRDPFGEKPLWVARRHRGEERLLVAASHPGAVAAVAEAFENSQPDWTPWPESAWPPPGAADPGPDAGDPEAWLERFLALGYAHPLAPGHVRAVPPTVLPEPEAGRDPDAPAAPDPLPADPGRWPAAIDAAIGRAVERRLEADVPLGCFLSGGVDSTLVTAHAVRRLGRLPSFTIRMPDPRHDESAHAAAAARTLGTEHHELPITPDVEADLDHLIAAAGLPPADSSILPAAWVCRAARGMVRCCLGGDGGDELFGGYDRYRGARLLAGGHRLLAHLPPGLGVGTSRHPRGRLRRLGRLGAMARDWPADGVLAMERLAPRPVTDRLRPSGGPPPWSVLHPSPDEAAATLRRLDLANYLPGDLMAKMDTASMSVALEVRSPLLDRDLVRIAAAIPMQAHLRGGTKRLLRDLARPILGSAADRPKQGFAIPLAGWLADRRSGLGARLADVLASGSPFGGLPIDLEAARSLGAEHVAGRRDHAAILFALLVLAGWARHRIPPPADRE
ncbi:MAG: asparagine synthetase B family protein [Planctomycetota bacterium]|jgi:asparagine synthase (glutamine-hydrolysing)